MKQFRFKTLLACLLIVFFYGIYKIYAPRVAAFGCFDDCFNYSAGFFITHGKRLYTDIFFNHQPAMAFISAGIQYTTHPINIYDLLLKHRQVLLIWNFFWAVLLTFRFGIVATIFTFLYEGTKFYIFGDRFLAEGMIVYPFVYLTATSFNILQKKKSSLFDSIVSLLLGIFIFLSREPYIPALVFPLGIVSVQMWQKWKKILFVHILLFCLFLILLPLPDYWKNVFIINQKTVLADSLTHGSIWELFFNAFLYPILIAIAPARTFFHQILLLIDLLFLLSIGILLSKKKFWSFLLFCFITLGLSNLRTVPVGQMYYESFHLLPWYGMFVFVTLLLTQAVMSLQKKTGVVLGGILLCTVLFPYISKEAFFKEHIDSQAELINNYGEEIKIGNAVKILSQPNDTLFLDGWGELIFWQANRISSYKYSWYTSVMPLIPEYVIQKENMFIHNPPDFYYGTCPEEKNSTRTMPISAKKLYIQLYSQGQPSCLWIRQSKLSTISNEQWNNVKEFLFDKPELYNK